MAPPEVQPDPQLSQSQLAALRNLSRKKAGADVGWIAIAAARALTDLGLAARERSGWQITAEGEALVDKLDKQGEAPGSPAKCLQFPGAPSHP
jgi:hypothetical protein